MSDTVSPAIPVVKRTALKVAIETFLLVAKSLLPADAFRLIEHLVEVADRELAVRPGIDRKSWVLSAFWTAPETKAVAEWVGGWLVSLLVDLIVARLRVRAAG